MRGFFVEKMAQIEGSPFTGKFKGFNGRSSDSVAGMITMRRTQDSSLVRKGEFVVKWNRREISSPDEAKGIAEFKRRSILLYQDALGKEFIVPTELVIGSKKDQQILKQKLYQIQPFIDAWTGRDVPETIKNDPHVLSQWQLLSQNLYGLYQAAHVVNQHHQADQEQFPITMTVGDSRNLSYVATESRTLPKTDNLFIRKNDLQLFLFDFGPYVVWQKEMEAAYQEIRTHAQKSATNLIFDANNM